MTRYYLNLRQGGRTYPDTEGIERARLEDVRPVAIAAARDVMAADIMDGDLDLSGVVEVSDRSGEILMTVAFSDVVTISGYSPRSYA